MRSPKSLLLVFVAWIAVTPTHAQAAKKFSSPYVDLIQASAMTPPGGRPSLVVILANRTEVPLWARVRYQSALSSDTQCCAIRRHPVLRTRPRVNSVSDCDLRSDLPSQTTPIAPHRLNCPAA